MNTLFLRTVSAGLCVFGMACAALPAMAQKPRTGGGTPELPAEARHVVSVESREQLFDTMCALDAAGFDAGNASADSPGRVQLRARMRALQGPATDAVRTYYREHAVAEPGATLSRFISFALAVGPPPNFAFELRREDLPPDALALEGFNNLLANFYREAKLDQLWAAYQPEYERGAQLYRAPVSDTVFSVTSYLREIVKSNSPRSFSVYVELLAGGNTNFRNYGDHYELVVSPATDPPLDEIRHAFLHFLLDPMAIRYRAEASRAASLLEYAARAPRLPLEFHDDYSAFFTECLVRAVELRLRHFSPAELGNAIDQAERSGYVMVRPIYAGLSGFEKSEPAMGYYLPELLKGIDVAAESRRVRSLKFADAGPPESSAAAAPAGPSVQAVAQGRAEPVDADLMEGQRQISARNGPAAASSFERVLSARPNDLRATYGLAVASALQGKPERARELFSRVIAAGSQSGSTESPDAGDLSWSHIYLGRMYDVEGQRDLAIVEYRAALAVNGAPASARAAAQRGVDAGYTTPARGSKADDKS